MAKRHKYDIIIDILQILAENPQRISVLIRKANTTLNQGYIQELEKKGYVDFKIDGMYKIISINQKGFELLKGLKENIKTIEEL